MKIVQINEVYGKGSTGKICSYITELCRKENIEVYNFSSGFWRKKGNESFSVGSRLSVKIHHFLSLVFGKEGLYSTLATKMMIKKIKEINPDIIQIHNIHGYYLNFKILFEYLNSFDGEIYWTFHDCWPFTGRCSHYSLVRCKKWKNGCDNCPQLSKYPASLILDKSKKLWSLKKTYFSSCNNVTLIAPSNWMKAQLEQSFLNKYPIKVIHNGVDINSFYYTHSNYLREKFDLGNRKILLGVSSVWDETKGIFEYIKLSNHLPCDKYVIVLVGTNNQVDKLLPDNIISIHKTSNVEELREIYCSADAFVNLTFEDTYPTVNLEALCCRLPLVTYNNCGSAEIAYENNGYVVNDFEKLVETLQSMSYEKTGFDNKMLDMNKYFEQYVKLYKGGI